MHPVQFQLLGTLQLTIDHKPITQFRSDKARALLAYLAVEAQHAHSRAALATLLWSESSDAAAKKNLRNVLYNLRQIAPELLTITRKTVQWQAPHDAVDLHRFSAQIGPTPEQAVTLYRGDFLHGFSLPDAPQFEEWRTIWQERLHQQVMNALERLTVAALGVENYEVSIGYANQQLALVAWHEVAHRWLMQTYAALGQRSAALDQFERCRQVLRDKLGIAPSAETLAMRADIEATQPVPHNLTHPPELIGRQAELKQLTKQIERRKLVTLRGVGGVGKSVLALTAAWQLLNHSAEKFPNGIWFVPLSGVSAAGQAAERLAAAIASTLHLTLRGTDSALTQLAAELRGKRLLLILDNAEHLAESAETVLHTLLDATSIHLLITSRVRVELQQAHEIALDGLALPHAVALFRRRAHRVYRQASATRTQIEALCQRVQGLPLAIELAASWVEHFSMDDLLTSIASKLAGDADDPQQAGLRGVFEHSWHYLAERERRILAQLSVFRGGFGRDAVLAITEGSLIEVSGLRSKSLVQLESAGRYALHEVVRVFSAEKAQQLNLVSAAENAHADHYLGLLQASETQPDAFNNVRAAWQYAHKHLNPRRLSSAALPYANLLQRQGLPSDLLHELRHSRETITSLPNADDWGNLIGEIALYECRALAILGATHDTLAVANIGLRRATDRELRSKLHGRIGKELAEQNQHVAAAEHYAQQAQLLRHSDDPIAIAQALAARAHHQTTHFIGDYREAIDQLREAVAIFERHPNQQHTMQRTLNRLSLAWGRLGNYGAAIETANRLRETTNDVPSMSLVDAHLLVGLCATYAGMHAMAIAGNERALAGAREIGDTQGIALLHSNQGMAHRRAGMIDEAIAFGRKAIKLNAPLDQLRIHGMAHNRLGHTLLAAGDLDAAAAIYATSLDIWLPSNHSNQFEARAGLSFIHATQDAPNLATAQLDAMVAFAQPDNLRKVAEPFVMLRHAVQAADLLGKTEQAAMLLKSAETRARTVASHNTDPTIRAAFIHHVNTTLNQSWSF